MRGAFDRTIIRLLGAIVSWVFIGLTAAPAYAGPLFELTGGDQDLGGFNARVAGASSASSYFNPALLPYAEPGVEIGLFMLSDHISIDLLKRTNARYDVPEGVNVYARPNRKDPNNPTALSPVPLPTKSLHTRGGDNNSDNTRVYQVVGLVNRFFHDQLAIGLHAMIPLEGFTEASAFYSDEREQYFSNSLHAELYSDRLAAAELAFALAGKIYEKLSLGVSFTLNLSNQAATPVYVSDAATFDNTLIDSRIDVSTAVSPHFGLVFDPHKRVRLTATVHTPQRMQIDTKFSYLLNNGEEHPSKSPISFVHGFLPWTAAVGGSYDVIAHSDPKSNDAKLSVVGTLLFSDWTEYLDRHRGNPSGGYEWSKTFTPSVGVRYTYGAFGSFFDTLYSPTPVPPQTGRTNYVDNDRVSFNAGVTYHFQLFKLNFRTGVQLQVHYLIRRFQRKLEPGDPGYDKKDPDQMVVDEVPNDAVDRSDLNAAAAGREGLQTNNPGWPGFSSGGYLIGGSAQLSVLF
jgi:long-chain fatty acid transport protein